MGNKLTENFPNFENRDFYIELGEHIAFYRKRAHLSQKELAKRLGITRCYLNRIESFNIVQSFSLEILFNISRELNVKPAYFFKPYPKNDKKENF